MAMLVFIADSVERLGAIRLTHYKTKSPSDAQGLLPSRSGLPRYRVWATRIALEFELPTGAIIFDFGPSVKV